MKYILALDQGTTSSRAMILDHAGHIRSSAQKEFRQFFPRPGWVEHDPQDIWTSQLTVARAAMKKAGLKAADIAAIGITNQRETAIVWDRRTGKPVYNAIVWQDRRTAPLCDRLKRRGKEPVFRRRTGLLLDPYFSGTKIAWLLDHVRGARRKAEAGQLAFGTVDTWLIWNMTGGQSHVTDASNASRTLLFNIRTGRWDEHLLHVLDIPAAILPRVVDSSGTCGHTTPRLLGRAIPIAGVAGDQQAALFGQMCVRPGMVKNTYGTGCFMLLNTGAKPAMSRNRLLTTVAWRIGGATTYALEGSVFVAGAVVQWLRDSLGLIKTSKDVESLAGRVADSGGVYFVPAFAGLGAPHWDPYARGTILGLTRGTGAAHLARAALESIAHQTADVLGAMAADAGVSPREIRVDGGAAVNNRLMQLQADLLGVRVVRPRNTETTALGAAYLAGLAVGYWKTPGEISSHWQKERVFTPSMKTSVRKRLRREWARALDRAKGWETGD